MGQASLDHENVACGMFRCEAKEGAGGADGPDAVGAGAHLGGHRIESFGFGVRV